MAKDKASLPDRKRRSRWMEWWWRLSTRNKVPILVAVISGVIAVFVALLQVFVSPFINKVADSLATRASVTPTAVLSSSLPCALETSPRYGFECGLSGWGKTEWPGTREAIEDVTTTQVANHDGISTTVLMLIVNFTGSKTEREEQFREAAEVQVNLDNDPPAGYETEVVDLTGRVVTAWVWASADSTGDISHKNGVQLFVRDSNDRNCYGKWNNIDREETWFRVIWRKSEAALCDPGFDSSRPKIFGLKIALGENAVYEYDKPLTIYLDDVDWQVP